MKKSEAERERQGGGGGGGAEEYRQIKTDSVLIKEEI